MNLLRSNDSLPGVSRGKGPGTFGMLQASLLAWGIWVWTELLRSSVLS
jgi:hypothetical protein